MPNAWWQVDLGASATVNSHRDLEPHGLLRLPPERLLGLRFGHAVPRDGHARDAAEPAGDVQQPSDHRADSIHHDCAGGRARPLRARATQRHEQSEPGRSAGVGDCRTSAHESGAWARRPRKAARLPDTPPQAPQSAVDGNTEWQLLQRLGDAHECGCQCLVAGGSGRFGGHQFGRRLEPHGLLQRPLERLLGLRFGYARSCATDTPATLQGRAGTFASHQTTAPNPSTTISGGRARPVCARATQRHEQSEPRGSAGLWHGRIRTPPPTDLAQGKAATPKQHAVRVPPAPVLRVRPWTASPMATSTTIR